MRPVEAAACPVARPHGQLLILILIVILLGLGFLEIKSKITIKSGACSVLIEGTPTHSCLTQVGKVRQKKIITIEGLEQRGRLHPLQEAFLEIGAMQCAYCTAGMVMSGVALLRRTPNPSREDIVRSMEGNICRCGTYPRIIAAIQRAAATSGGAK